MKKIDISSLIYDCVSLGDSSIVEPFAIVGIQDRFHPPAKVVIGKRAFIGSRCTIYAGVFAGDDLDVSDQTTIFTDNILGDRVRIGPKTVMKNGCRIGNDVRINAQVFMERVVVEDFVFVGPHTVFADDKHPPCPRYAECVPKCHVESYVSIGANVTIAPGVRIGHHCQIYSGAVLLKDVPPNSVVAGNPARVVKSFDELECSAGLFVRPFEWWVRKS
jgi:UDP-2-acetamido-3-amino-2,3-dideoxy-glucuronate N-acetyltransferase